MPKVLLKESGGSIIYDQDDWLLGLDTSSADENYYKMGGNALMSGISVLRKFGYIQPSPLPTDVTGVAEITAVIRKAVNIGDDAYMVSSDSLVHKMSTLLSGTISTTSPFPHTIDHAHTNEAGNDIAIYYTGTTQRVFYSFNDDTDWDVGIYNVVADTFDDNFMSTTPTGFAAFAALIAAGKGYPHPLIVGDDDVLYMGDRNFIHVYDGATDTVFTKVLTLPVGWVITSFALTEDIKLAIGSYLTTASFSDTFQRGGAKVWFWNYLDLDPLYACDLRDNYVSEIKQWAGTTIAFTSGPKSPSDLGPYKLQALNGSQFEVIKTWDTGGLPIRGGVDNVNNDLYWNSASRVYAYTKRPDNGQHMLNTISNNQSGVSGMLRFFTQSSTIHYSWGAGAGNGGLQYLSGGYTTSTFKSQVAAPEFGIRQRGRLSGLTIAFADKFTGGREIQLLTLLDRASVQTLTPISVLTKTRYAQFTTNSNGTPLGDFNTLQLQLSWSGGVSTSAPAIEWVRYDFTTVNI